MLGTLFANGGWILLGAVIGAVFAVIYYRRHTATVEDALAKAVEERNRAVQDATDAINKAAAAAKAATGKT